jgi:hypothetical protein
VTRTTNVRQTGTTDGASASATGRGDRSRAWYATEVPSIVAGLQATRTISTGTANRAWRLIEAGAYDRALAVALGEAV